MVTEKGKIAPSGLTDKNLHVFEDAFTPGRNLLFLLVAAAFGYNKGADAVAIGLLNEKTRLFPDQSLNFLKKAEKLIQICLNTRITVVAPLIEFSKSDVVSMAKKKGIKDTYSCHVGDDNPCGKCIACREFLF